MLLCRRRTCRQTLVVALLLSANFLNLGESRSPRNRALLEIALLLKSRSCSWRTLVIGEIALYSKSRSPWNHALVVRELVALKLSLSSRLRSCSRSASVTCLGLVTSWEWWGAMEAPYSALDERSRRRTIEKGRFNTFYEYKHSTFVSRQKIFWEQTILGKAKHSVKGYLESSIFESSESKGNQL